MLPQIVTEAYHLVEETQQIWESHSDESPLRLADSSLHTENRKIFSHIHKKMSNHLSLRATLESVHSKQMTQPRTNR